MSQTFWGDKLDSADGAKGSLILLAATFAAYMAFGPLRLYFQNRYYYDLDALTAIFAALGLSLALFILIFGIVSAVRSAARVNCMRVLFCFIVAVFVYDNILFFLVPELDGSALAVTSSLFVGLDAAVIGLLIFLALKTTAFADWQFMSRALFFILAFSGLQLAFAVFSPKGEPDDALPDEVKEIVLSPNRNIIHVLFDMFQATEFGAALEEVGGENSLPGFIWFRDSLGVHSSTSFSLPSVFAGKVYREDNMREYYSGEDKTFLDVLAAKNFDQTIFTALPIPGSANTKKSRAIALLDERQSAVSELGQLLDLFFIRAGPFLLKDYFLNDYNYRLARLDRQTTPIGNDRFKRAFVNFSNRLVVSQDAKTRDRYYFLHLIYPHPPFTHNADCTAADGVVPRSPQQARIELRCSLRDFVAFLERLKEAGAYDETMIIMQGDTGGGHKVAALQYSKLPEAIRYGMPFPVLLVKDFGAQGAMTVSDKPASIQDVPNIVLGVLGLEPEFPGYDLMSDVDISSRERYFRTWRVQPDALAASSWSRMKSVDIALAQPQTAQLGAGDVVSFRGDGLGHLYRSGRGWSGTRAHGTWAYYPEAKLKITIDRASASEVNALRFQVRLPGAVGPSRRIRYSVNGAAPEDIDFDFKSKRLAFFDIPISENVTREEFRLSFLFDAPMNDQISDPRALGFLIEEMSVE